MSREKFYKLHRGLAVHSSVIHGRGTFATRNLPKGTLLLVIGGHIMTLQEEAKLPQSLQDAGVQIASDLVLSPPRGGAVSLLAASATSIIAANQTLAFMAKSLLWPFGTLSAAKKSRLIMRCVSGIVEMLLRTGCNAIAGQRGAGAGLRTGTGRSLGYRPVIVVSFSRTSRPELNRGV